MKQPSGSTRRFPRLPDLLQVRQAAWPAAIALALFLGEVFYSLFVSQRILGGREGSLLKDAVTVHWPYFVGFYARVFALHTVFAVVLVAICLLFRVRRTGLFSGIAALYAFCHAAVITPQLFDDIPALTPLLRVLVSSGPVTPFAVAVFLLALLTGSMVRERRSATLTRIVAQMVALAGLSYYFFVSQTDTSVSIPRFAAQGGNQRPHIILLGVDGLRADALELGKNVDPTSPIGRFLSSSAVFENVTSPIARTHPAFVSIFKAEQPARTGIRFNLEAEARDTDRLLSGSLLEAFRESGYHTSLQIDAVNFAYFLPGRALNEVEAPPPGFHNNVLPILHRNRLFFSLFHNEVGRWFLPEVADNAAFSPGFKLNDYSSLLLRRLSQKTASSQPALFMSHTTALHFPGAFRYPYYKVLDGSEMPAPAFSYTSLYISGAFEFRDPGPRRLEYFKELYAGGVKQVMDLHLNPVLGAIEEAGLLENSIVVLFSDHGENLWGDQPLPLRKFPSHGESLLFEDVAAKSFLAIRVPGGKAHRVTASVGLVDLFPTLADLAGIKSFATRGQSLRSHLSDATPGTTGDGVYSAETGYWPTALYPGQTFLHPWHNLWAHRVDDNGLVFIDPSFRAPLALQKQRAVVEGDFRLTVFPTIFGYRLMLTNTRLDPAGRTNLAARDPALARRLFRSYGEGFHPDVEQGYLAPLVFNESEPERPLWSMGDEEFIDRYSNDPSRYQWLLLQRTLETIYGKHDLLRGSAWIQRLVGTEGNHPVVRMTAINLAYDLCIAGFDSVYEVPFSRNFLDFSPISMALPTGFKLNTYARQYRCFDKAGAADAKAGVLNHLREMKSAPAADRIKFLTRTTAPDPQTALAPFTTSASFTADLNRYTQMHRHGAGERRLREVFDAIHDRHSLAWQRASLELARWRERSWTEFARDRKPATAPPVDLDGRAYYGLQGLSDSVQSDVLAVYAGTGALDEFHNLVRTLTSPQMTFEQVSMQLTDKILRLFDQIYEPADGETGFKSPALRRAFFNALPEVSAQIIDFEDSLLRYYMSLAACKTTDIERCPAAADEARAWARVRRALLNNETPSALAAVLQKSGAPAFITRAGTYLLNERQKNKLVIQDQGPPISTPAVPPVDRATVR